MDAPSVGQAILPAAAFQAALSGLSHVFALVKRRLKGGCSQDWLPHKILHNSQPCEN